MAIKATSECDVSFKQKPPTIVLLHNFFYSHVHCTFTLLKVCGTHFTKIRGKFLDYDEFCTNERKQRKNFGK